MGLNGRPSQGKFPREKHTGKNESKPQVEEQSVPGGTITKAKRGEKAKRAEKPGRSTPSLQIGDSIVSLVPPRKALTYADLMEYHLDRIRFDEDGNERSIAVLKNHRSVINSWVLFRLAIENGAPIEGGADQVLLGDEMGTNFITALNGYVDYQEKRGKKKSTINDRRSILLAVKESANELIKLDGLPEDFAGALEYLVRNSGMTRLEIAKAVGFEESRIYKWTTGKVLPFLSSLPLIERLEDLFKVHRGTLSSRLPLFKVTHGDGRPRTCTTAWREHLSQLQKFPYTLKKLPSRVEEEFSELVLYKTNDAWVEQQDLERTSEWRIRENRGTAPTADVFYRSMKCFLSFLHLSPDADHPWMRGKGFSLESMTLALCSDANLVFSYIEFMKERSHSKCYNTGVITFLAHCKTMLKKENGYLRQHPKYGSLLPTPVPPDEWDGWCESNRKRMLKFLNALKKSKNRPFKMSRDPFDAVRNIIEGRQHPISALMEMAAGMKMLIPLKAKYRPTRLPVLMRDIAFVELITSFPMRIENFSALTWIPVDPADLLACNKEYIETTPNSNLYQKPDGSWWIRLREPEVKNGKPIDVPVVESVVPSLKEYLFNHRPVLNRDIKRAILKRRSDAGLRPLTTKEERAIDLCPYVFRPAATHPYTMDLSKLPEYRGVEQMSGPSLSYIMFNLSQKYIPNCKGFRAHSVRHIVASEYIKNYPNGYAVAAAALNITEEVVRKHYAWVRPCDQIKPWQEYHESLRKQLDKELSLV